jgi:hypothetical protein
MQVGRWAFLFLLLAALLPSSCGARRQLPLPDDKDQLPDDPEPNEPSEDSWGDVQPLLSSFCSECHSDAVFMSTERGFIASKAPARLINKSMPPSYAKAYGKWTSADRQRLIDFVEANK